MKKKDETAVTEQEQIKGETAATEQGENSSDEAAASEQQPPAPPEQPEPPVMVSVVCLTNIKHDKDFYQAGQRVDLPEEVFAALQRAKAVRRIGD